MRDGCWMDVGWVQDECGRDGKERDFCGGWWLPPLSLLWRRLLVLPIHTANACSYACSDLSMTTSFLDLPAEITSAIAQKLDVKDLMGLRWLCRASSTVIRGDRALFRRILFHKFHRKLTTRDKLEFLPLPSSPFHADPISRPRFICVRRSFLEAVEVLAPRDARVILKVHVGPTMTLKRDLILRKGNTLRTNFYDAVQIRRCHFCVVYVSFDMLDSGLAMSEIEVTTVSLSSPADMLAPPRGVFSTPQKVFLLPRPLYMPGGYLVHYILNDGEAVLMFCRGQHAGITKCSCRL
jgi:hypothetical protein